MDFLKAIAEALGLARFLAGWLENKQHEKTGRQKERLDQRDKDAETARKMADAGRAVDTSPDRLRDDDGYKRSD